MTDMTVENPRLAMIFPGQGAQRGGMLAELARQFPQVGETFAQSSSVLGYDLWELASGGDEQRLALTEYTQPLMLTAGVAVWRVWCACQGARPGWMAGHSLGEFSALVCAGALGFEEAVALVRERGRLMQQAVPADQGAMAAVLGLEAEKVVELCREISQSQSVVEAANFNAPSQTVIAGHRQAVERATKGCQEAGARKVMPLPVSAPFHTSLMQPVAEGLRKALGKLRIRSPEITVVHNVSALPESDPDRLVELLVEQAHRPVRWSMCVTYLRDQGVDHFVECGPGKVLAGLVRQLDRNLRCEGLENPEVLKKALAGVGE